LLEIAECVKCLVSLGLNCEIAEGSVEPSGKGGSIRSRQILLNEFGVL